MGHDDHWRLKSGPTLSVNVLVNGSPEKPAVWVFEPQTVDDGVISRRVITREDIEQAIKAIQSCLQSPSPQQTAR